MIRRKGEYPTELRERYRGAPGSVRLEHLMTPEEYFGKGRLFATCRLAPGSGVGYHEHRGEMELFYILEGTAQVTENGKDYLVSAGVSIITGDGQAHSLLAVGESDLVYLAVILFKGEEKSGQNP